MPRTPCVLTGASSGIGAALAPMLAKEGYDLVLVARREAELARVAEQVRAAEPAAVVEVFTLDLAKPGAGERLFERAPGAKLVVNSAGFGKLGPALKYDLETYHRMIALNVSAITDITYVYAKRMSEDGGGTVCNIASTAGFQPIPYFTVYAATKAYVVSFCEGLHFELRKKGVNVLAYCPGPVDTPFEAAAEVPAEMLTYSHHFMITAEHCARVAVKAIRRRAENVVPGFWAGLGAIGARWSPRRLARWSAAFLFRPPGV